MKKKKILLSALLLLSGLQLEAATIFKGANVFNGKENKLYKNYTVVVEENKISKITEKSIKPLEGDVVIDAKGKTLMPGLIDSHVHMNLLLPNGNVGMVEQARWDEIAVQSTVGAHEWFYDGFTTVRGMGGTLDGLKNAIDRGDITGPRLYPSGAFLTQTAGHGDTKSKGNDKFNSQGNSNVEDLGISIIVDSEDEARRAVRWNFGNGASQIKIMGSGGVTSRKDPLFATQFTDEEIKAIVKEAEARDSYVAAHLIDDKAIYRAIKLGVKSIEHGHYLSPKSAKLLKKNDGYISINYAPLSDEMMNSPAVKGSPVIQKKLKEVMEKGKDFSKIVEKYKLKKVFNTDIIFLDPIKMRMARDFEIYMWTKNHGNFETLKALTSTAGELLRESGRSNPYPGKLGVIEKGAYADILLVDGNPLEDMKVLGANNSLFGAKPRAQGHDTIKLIMKDGKVFKNTLK